MLLITKSMFPNQLYFCIKHNRKFKNEISFIVHSNMKYLGINLTTDVQDLYTKNSKLLLRKIKSNLNKRQIYCLYEKGN